MKENHHVKWSIFVWAIGIMLLLFGISFTMLGATNGRLEEVSDNTKASMLEIKVQLSAISTDIQWIKTKFIK